MKRIDPPDLYYVSAIFAFTVFFAGPSMVYLHNVRQLKFTFWELIPYLSISSAVIFALAVLLFRSIASSSHYTRLLALVFASSIAFWVQGNIFVWNYGEFGGDPIDWKSKTFQGVMEAILWLAFLGLALAKAQSFRRFIRTVSITLIVFQLAYIVIVHNSIHYTCPQTHKNLKSLEFDFSKDKNVILLVVDSFQSDVFQKIVNKSERFAGMLDGFTYFRNAGPVGKNTTAAMPVIMTARYYDGSVTYEDYIEEAFLSNSLPQVLKANGFSVYLYRSWTVTSCDERVASNFAKKEYMLPELSELATIFDITIFRYSPHFIKMLITDSDLNEPYLIRGFLGAFNEGKVGGKHFYNNRDAKWMDKFARNANVNASGKVFKFLYLRGLHRPYGLDENRNRANLPFSRDSLTRTAVAEVKNIEIFLDTLKRLGIYDKSMIIICGDHGASASPGHANKVVADGKTAAYLVPMLLVKPFNSRGEFLTSDAPVSLADIPQTVFHELSLNIQGPGMDMFDLSENKARIRPWILITEYIDMGDGSRKAKLDVWHIIGHSWDRRAWFYSHKLP